MRSLHFPSTKPDRLMSGIVANKMARAETLLGHGKLKKRVPLLDIVTRQLLAPQSTTLIIRNMNLGKKIDVPVGKVVVFGDDDHSLSKAIKSCGDSVISWASEKGFVVDGVIELICSSNTDFRRTEFVSYKATESEVAQFKRDILESASIDPQVAQFVALHKEALGL